MQLSIARDSGRDNGPATQHDRHTTAPISALGFHPVARRLLQLTTVGGLLQTETFSH